MSDYTILFKIIIAIMAPTITAAMKIINKPKKRISCTLFLAQQSKDKKPKDCSKQDITIKFCNKGSKPLIKEDFHRPLILEFKDDSKVIDYQIICKNPSNIELDVKKENNNITIFPDLMNKNESFELSISLKNYKKESLNILHRMIDVDLKLSKQSDINFSDYIRIGLSITIYCLIILFIYKTIGPIENMIDIFKEFAIAIFKSLLILPIAYLIINFRLPKKKFKYTF